MSDLVVTVPRDLWLDWIDEGDAVGEPETGEEWGFFCGRVDRRPRPPVQAGDRLYIVSHDRIRGYAPITRVVNYEGSWAIGRKGSAMAVTIPEHVGGFRGWRKRWWSMDIEVPFPQWRTDDLWLNRARARARKASKNVQEAPSETPERSAQSELFNL